MAKHNKKRNVGVIYELLLKHMSDCLIENDIESLKKATAIVEKRFSKNTELYKEFRLFNALAKTTASDTHIVASILSEAKSAARRSNVKKLNKEKSDLIRDINYKINDKSFYYRNISNYRDLATIQITLDEWRKEDNCNIQRLIEYEKKVGEILLIEKLENSIDQEAERLKASDSDKLVLKIMTEKLNKKYGDSFTDDQKEIIRNYAIYSENNHEYLSEYFSTKKKEVLNLLEDFEDIEENKFIIKKVDNVRSCIKELNVSEVSDDTVIRFLTLTNLISELKKVENKNV